MEISKYIYEYLAEYNISLVVPDLGCFEIVQKPSEIKNGVVGSPVRTVVFDSENSEDDNIFTYYIAKKEGITHVQAAEEVKRFYNKFFIQKLTLQQQPITFPNFGTFSLKAGDILFEPVADFFKDNFGLGAAHISPAAKKSEPVAPKVSPAVPKPEPVISVAPPVIPKPTPVISVPPPVMPKPEPVISVTPPVIPKPVAPVISVTPPAIPKPEPLVITVTPPAIPKPEPPVITVTPPAVPKPEPPVITVTPPVMPKPEPPVITVTPPVIPKPEPPVISVTPPVMPVPEPVVSMPEPTPIVPIVQEPEPSFKSQTTTSSSGDSLFDMSDKTRYRENTERRRPAPTKERNEPSAPPKVRQEAPKQQKAPPQPKQKDKKVKAQKESSGKSYRWLVVLFLVVGLLGAGGYFGHEYITAFLESKDISIPDIPFLSKKTPVVDDENEEEESLSLLDDENSDNDSISMEFPSDETTDMRNALNPDDGQTSQTATTPSTPATTPSTPATTPSTPATRPSTPATTPAATQPVAAVQSGSGRWIAIIGSFSTRAAAEAFVRQVQASDGLNCEIIDAGNARFRVSAGRFETEAQANDFANQIRPTRQGQVWVTRN